MRQTASLLALAALAALQSTAVVVARPEHTDAAYAQICTIQNRFVRYEVDQHGLRSREFLERAPGGAEVACSRSIMSSTDDALASHCRHGGAAEPRGRRWRFTSDGFAVGVNYTSTAPSSELAADGSVDATMLAVAPPLALTKAQAGRWLGRVIEGNASKADDWEATGCGLLDLGEDMSVTINMTDDGYSNATAGQSPPSANSCPKASSVTSYVGSFVVGNCSASGECAVDVKLSTTLPSGAKVQFSSPGLMRHFEDATTTVAGAKRTIELIWVNHICALGIEGRCDEAGKRPTDFYVSDDHSMLRLTWTAPLQSFDGGGERQIMLRTKSLFLRSFRSGDARSAQFVYTTRQANWAPHHAAPYAYADGATVTGMGNVPNVPDVSSVDFQVAVEYVLPPDTDCNWKNRDTCSWPSKTMAVSSKTHTLYRQVETVPFESLQGCEVTSVENQCPRDSSAEAYPRSTY